MLGKLWKLFSGWMKKNGIWDVFVLLELAILVRKTIINKVILKWAEVFALHDIN